LNCTRKKFYIIGKKVFKLFIGEHRFNELENSLPVILSKLLNQVHLLGQ